MFSLTVTYGSDNRATHQYSLLYNKKEDAEKAAAKALDSFDNVNVVISDDFGHDLTLTAFTKIYSTAIDDLEKSQEGTVVLSIYQMKTQARTMLRARTDAEISKASQMLQPGMPMGSPGGLYRG